MIREWGNIPFRIESPYGTLTFNDETNPLGLFLLDDSKCSVGVPLRLTKDTIPQGSGGIFHRPRLQAETTMTLGVGYWQEREQPACADQLVDMDDYLMGVLVSLLDADQGRVFWTPSGHAERLLDDVLYAVQTAAFKEGDVESGRTFSLDSPFPYAIDAAQDTIAIADGATESVTNDGNTNFWAVFKAYGPTTTFEIINHSIQDADGNDLYIRYDAARPGAQTIAGSHYAELDFFRNTIYLDGDQGNLKPGLDIEVSDFFPLKPGVNMIEASGADVDLLLNNAWAG